MLKDELLQDGLEFTETHISWVFLSDEEVWKVKKPVDLGFLDFSEPAKRRAACEAECELNRRLSPDVYLGVVPITRRSDGRHQFGGDSSEAVDWAVHMRRLPDDDRADVRIKRGQLTEEHMDGIAEQLAAFHEVVVSDHGTARFGTVNAIRANVHENFVQTRDTILKFLTADEARQIEERQRAFLDTHPDLFRMRIATGMIRDGHGDLRLDQIYVDDTGRARILDCIEFNERFRYADVCADVAFLAMDLSQHNRTDLAEQFLARYAQERNDHDLYPLVDFYQSYRAFVRGKVLSILAHDPEAESAVRDAAERETRRYYLLALAAERRALLPRAVVAVGGLIASGKSTVATQLARAMGTAVVGTDRTRKHLIGVDPLSPLRHPLGEGAYSPAMTRNVYYEVFRRANAILESGRGVAMDGSFGTREQRSAARRLAVAHDVPFFFVECRADEHLLRERLRDRALDASVSDGRTELLEDITKRWEPADEIDSDCHVILDTSRPLDANVDWVRRQVPTWPAQMTT